VTARDIASFPMSRSMFIPFLLSHSVADWHYLTIESNFAACDERNHSSLLPSLEFLSNGNKLSRKTFFVGQCSEILAHENLVWQVVRGIAHECAAHRQILLRLGPMLAGIVQVKVRLPGVDDFDPATSFGFDRIAS
jgi:hypothetical protein